VVLAFTAGILLLQAAWIITLPAFRGSDEFDHAYRAVAVAGGEWRATRVPDNGRGYLVSVPESLVDAAHAQCAALSYTGPDNCSPVQRLGAGKVLVASGAASYNPVFYAVIGWAAAPFEGSSALYALRVSGALLCVSFIGSACWALGRQRSRWPLAAMVLALSPVFLYSTSLGAPNGLEMSAALALWASLLALQAGTDVRAERPLLWLAVAAAIALSTARLLGPLFLVMIVVSLAVLDGGSLVRVLRRHRRSAVVGFVLVSASVAAAATWVLITGSAGPPRESEGTTYWHASSIVRWLLQTIAAFPFQDQPGAWIAYPVVGALTVSLTVVALRVGTRRERLALALAVAVAVGLPVVLTLLTRDGRGVIWQGRYGLPYNVGFVLMAGTILGRRFRTGRLPPVLVWPSVAGLAVATTACLVKIRDDELTRAASTSDPSWHVPSVALLVMLTGLAAAAHGRALTVGARAGE
jgi:hypothetical protein